MSLLDHAARVSGRARHPDRGPRVRPLLGGALCGVKVLRFSVGFGTPLWRRRLGPDQTEWVVAAFPLGGYVKMLDEREGEVAPQELHRAFNRQSVYRRIAIVVAGPLANFLLAIVVYWALFMHGVPGRQAGAGRAACRHARGAGRRGLRRDHPAHRRPAGDDLGGRALGAAGAGGGQGQRRPLEVRNEKGEIAFRKLDLSGLSAADLDSDFLNKIGLTPVLTRR